MSWERGVDSGGAGERGAGSGGAGSGERGSGELLYHRMGVGDWESSSETIELFDCHSKA